MSEPVESAPMFAVAADIVDRYGPIPEDQAGLVSTLIEDASQMLVDRYPLGVSRATASTLRRITCRMVWESLDHTGGADPVVPGAESMQMGVGIFQRSWKLGSAQGRLFISKEDRLALRGSQRAASVNLLAHLDPEP